MRTRETKRHMRMHLPGIVHVHTTTLRLVPRLPAGEVEDVNSPLRLCGRLQLRVHLHAPPSYVMPAVHCIRRLPRSLPRATPSLSIALDLDTLPAAASGFCGDDGEAADETNPSDKSRNPIKVGRAQKPSSTDALEALACSKLKAYFSGCHSRRSPPCAVSSSSSCTASDQKMLSSSCARTSLHLPSDSTSLKIVPCGDGRRAGEQSRLRSRDGLRLRVGQAARSLLDAPLHRLHSDPSHSSMPLWTAASLLQWMISAAQREPPRLQRCVRAKAKVRMRAGHVPGRRTP
jgi:hypothetical protein